MQKNQSMCYVFPWKLKTIIMTGIFDFSCFFSVMKKTVTDSYNKLGTFILKSKLNVVHISKY